MTTIEEALLRESAEGAYKSHADVNQFYDGDLPYSFHLKLARKVGMDYLHLLGDGPIEAVTSPEHGRWEVSFQVLVLMAIDWHDSIEDCRLTYNDVKSRMSKAVAEIVYAVTNHKGKNRKERANDAYYQEIVETPGATFVKLCDRIANVKFGLLMGSRMTEVYRKEYPNFKEKLNYSEDHPLKEMFDDLEALLNK